MKIKASVKEIVELIYGTGDLVSEEYLHRRAQEGTLIHQDHQRKYKASDKSEVYVKYEEETEAYSLFISGRIDGVIQSGKKVIIEEIKSTTRDLDNVDELTVPAHLAQAKVYAHLYFLNSKKRKIDIRLTYIQVENRKIKKIDLAYTTEELAEFFRSTIDLYLEWLQKIDEHENRRNKSIAGLSFPYLEYREGQRELMGACYRSILNQDVLFAIAPTGVGKTIATLFAALKTINQQNQKLFYLTAKNLGKKVVLDTVALLMAKGLEIKAIEITSKDNICFQDERDCDPTKCPYSRDYFSKLFPALQDLFLNEGFYNKETISEYSRKHEVCPFEFSLDASYYADIIICDYNYAFCPRTHLIRYFDDGSNYVPILLVDEAHNLVSRSKDMYSGEISKIMLLTLNKYLKANNCNIKNIFTVLKHLNQYEEEIAIGDYQVREINEELIGFIEKLILRIEDFFAENKEIKHKLDIIKIVMDLRRFQKMSEFFDDDFVYTVERNENNLLVAINCLDASKFILKTIKEKTSGTVFFSATLYPLNYYKKMLTQDEGHFIRIDSPFEKSNLKLITINSLSTRYRDRKASICKIIKIIKALGESKVGNYIVFFPSYSYLKMVLESLDEADGLDYIVQKPDFTQAEREAVVNLFKSSEKTQIGLFVMGGMFAEGIDYIGDMLSGVIIIGTGLPMYGGYNNIVKAHFDKKFNNGFDFAYTYPGFAKVVQAVGRVIRTETDRGIAILVDDRFANQKYLHLYPKEWSDMLFISESYELEDEIESFWNQKTPV
ncbi:MAG: helicase C-terminal domain-containing protein [Bacilli bacterium]|nr:helicase C-terminal domain-containing protein [Bacilli bacterium]